MPVRGWRERALHWEEGDKLDIKDVLYRGHEQFDEAVDIINIESRRKDEGEEDSLRCKLVLCLMGAARVKQPIRCR